jgi:hypothetical protein
VYQAGQHVGAEADADATDADLTRRALPSVPALPSRARLLHIGVPKSGTTAVQSAAAGNRELLLAHGVRYPGGGFNHKQAAFAVLGLAPGWSGDVSPLPMAPWRALMREVERERRRRLFISHESLCEADDAQAARIAGVMGPRLHVVITLRGYAALLCSTWQQNVKSGARLGLPAWLKMVLADPPDPQLSPRFPRRTDQAAMVARWVRLLGPERVTAVVPDKTHPDLLVHAFADLLGIPREVFRPTRTPDGLVNRSLSMPEAELIRAVNQVVRHEDRVHHGQYTQLVREGAVRRLLAERRPGATEVPITLPEWAAQRAAERARRHAAAIATSGCTVIGDLDALAALGDHPPRISPVSYVPVTAAAEAVAGVVSAATGRRARFEGRADPGAGPFSAARRAEAERITTHLSSASLLAELATRQYRALRRVLQLP